MNDTSSTAAGVRPSHPHPGPGARIVIPPDTRIRVNPTTGFPYRCIGQITASFPGGSSYTGTGTLIDEFHVLTCAHVLFSPDDGGFATSVSFAPARNGRVEPWGSIAASRLSLPEEYVTAPPPSPFGNGLVDYTQYLYDFALVTLGSAVDFDAYPAPAWVDNGGLRGVACSVTGYPGDKPPGTMWGASGQVQTEDTEQFLFYRISTYAGESGAAVMGRFDPRVPGIEIVGVHVAGTVVSGEETNFAVRLSPEVLGVITGWM